jgi:hypothetical protein
VYIVNIQSQSRERERPAERGKFFKKPKYNIKIRKTKKNIFYTIYPTTTY